MGVRLGADLHLRLGGSWFTPLANLRRAGGAPWTWEQLLHVALAAVAILGWSLVYVTLMRDIDPPRVAKDSLRTEVSVNLVQPR